MSDRGPEQLVEAEKPQSESLGTSSLEEAEKKEREIGERAMGLTRSIIYDLTHGRVFNDGKMLSRRIIVKGIEFRCFSPLGTEGDDTLGKTNWENPACFGLEGKYGDYTFSLSLTNPDILPQNLDLVNIVERENGYQQGKNPEFPEFWGGFSLGVRKGAPLWRDPRDPIMQGLDPWVGLKQRELSEGDRRWLKGAEDLSLRKTGIEDLRTENGFESEWHMLSEVKRSTKNEDGLNVLEPEMGIELLEAIVARLEQQEAGTVDDPGT